MCLTLSWHIDYNTADLSVLPRTAFTITVQTAKLFPFSCLKNMEYIGWGTYFGFASFAKGL